MRSSCLLVSVHSPFTHLAGPRPTAWPFARALSLAVLTACGDDASSGGGSGGATSASGTTAAASSSTGRVAESEVHFHVMCDGALIRVDCAGAELTRRRADTGAISFDCRSRSAYARALLFAPGLGDAKTWMPAPRRIFAGCTGATTRDAVVNPVSEGDAIQIDVFEPGVFVEGTFTDGAGALQGTFAIYDADAQP